MSRKNFSKILRDKVYELVHWETNEGFVFMMQSIK